MDYPAPIIIEPTQTHTQSIIWLHGLGANAEDFYSLVPQIKHSNYPHCRWIFANAPTVPVTLNNGMRMPSWFDIYNLTDPIKGVSVDDIVESADYLDSLIEQEMHRQMSQQSQQSDPSPNILIAGFSQGGVIALHSGIRWQRSNLTVLALSCSYLKLRDFYQNSNYQRTFHVMHGKYDDIVPLKNAQLTLETLEQLGLSTHWYQYPVAHSLHPQQILDIKNLL